MIINELSLQSVELKLQLLNQKVDKIIEIMSSLLEKKKKIKQEETDTNWSIVDYKNSVLVSFSFNMEFKNYIKEIGVYGWYLRRHGCFQSQMKQKLLLRFKKNSPHGIN